MLNFHGLASLVSLARHHISHSLLKSDVRPSTTSTRGLLSTNVIFLVDFSKLVRIVENNCV